MSNDPLFPEWTVGTPIEDAVFQLIGAASVCWSAIGVFDTQRAQKLGNEFLDLLYKMNWADDGDDVSDPVREEIKQNFFAALARDKNKITILKDDQ